MFRVSFALPFVDRSVDLFFFPRPHFLTYYIVPRSTTQAYWNVATKRLVDNVCMTMEQDFVVKLLGKVESELFLLTNRYTDVEELFVEVNKTKETVTKKKQ